MNSLRTQNTVHEKISQKLVQHIILDKVYEEAYYICIYHVFYTFQYCFLLFIQSSNISFRNLLILFFFLLTLGVHFSHHVRYLQNQMLLWCYILLVSFVAFFLSIMVLLYLFSILFLHYPYTLFIKVYSQVFIVFACCYCFIFVSRILLLPWC